MISYYNEQWPPLHAGPHKPETSYDSSNETSGYEQSSAADHITPCEERIGL